MRENPDLVDKSCESRQNARGIARNSLSLTRSAEAVAEELGLFRQSAVLAVWRFLCVRGQKEEAEAPRAGSS